MQDVKLPFLIRIKTLQTNCFNKAYHAWMKEFIPEFKFGSSYLPYQVFNGKITWLCTLNRKHVCFEIFVTALLMPVFFIFQTSLIKMLILTLSWRRPLSYGNQSIDLRRKSIDWFLYDNGLRQERLNLFWCFFVKRN